MNRLSLWLAILVAPVSAQTSVEGLWERAGRWIQEGKMDSAVSDLRTIEANRSASRRIDALLSLGRIAFENLQRPEEALGYYHRVYSDYPGHPLRAHAVFMLGFLYANSIIDLERAKAYYSEFLRDYPDHELTPSVRFEMDHLGKKIDELLQHE